MSEKIKIKKQKNKKKTLKKKINLIQAPKWGRGAPQHIKTMTGSTGSSESLKVSYEAALGYLKKFHAQYSLLKTNPTQEKHNFIVLCNAILNCGISITDVPPATTMTLIRGLGKHAAVNGQKLYEAAEAIQNKLEENESYRTQTAEMKQKISELEAEIEKLHQDHQRSRVQLQRETTQKQKELVDSHNTTLSAKEAEIQQNLKDLNNYKINAEIKIQELEQQIQALSDANVEEAMEIAPGAKSKKRTLDEGNETPSGEQASTKARKILSAKKTKNGDKTPVEDGSKPGSSGVDKQQKEVTTPNAEVVDLTRESNNRPAEHTFPQAIIDQVNERKSWKNATQRNRFLTWGESRINTDRNWAEKEVLKAFRARLCKKHKGDLDKCDCSFKAVEFRELKHEDMCYMLLEFDGKAGERVAISDMLIEHGINAVDTFPHKWEDNIVKPSKQKAPRKTDKYFLTRLQAIENTPEELLELMQNACKQIVTATRVLKGNTPTDTVILEVKKTKTANKAMQTALKAGGLAINGLLRPISKERPKPLMCSKCHKLGHGANACKEDKPTCPKCGGDHRASEHPAEEPKKCVNCGGPHSSTQWACPKMRQAQKEQAKKPKPQKNTNNSPVGPKPKKDTPPTKPTKSTKTTKTNLKCHRCNEVGHIAANCSKADTRQCYNCRKTGHIASACRAPRRNQGFSSGAKKAPNLAQMFEVQLADLMKNAITQMVSQMGRMQ